jgi:peptide/nickel transport system substrate-binding protein
MAAAVSAYAVPAFHIVPRSVFGHDPEAPSSSRDIVKARRLLETAGYRNGFDVALHDVVAHPNPVADEVKAQLAEIGIRVTLVATPSTPDFFAALRRVEFAFWSIGLGSATGEAGWLLSTYFHSPDPARGLGLENAGGVADRELDRAIEEADAILRPSERLPALQRAVRLAENSRLYIPLLQRKTLFIVDRALVFEPRNDLQLRYAEIGSQGR